ncbi:hypothetical protein XPA_001847 [Xanthoria parietina]
MGVQQSVPHDVLPSCESLNNLLYIFLYWKVSEIVVEMSFCLVLKFLRNSIPNRTISQHGFFNTLRCILQSEGPRRLASKCNSLPGPLGWRADELAGPHLTPRMFA